MAKSLKKVKRNPSIKQQSKSVFESVLKNLKAYISLQHQREYERAISEGKKVKRETYEADATESFKFYVDKHMKQWDNGGGSSNYQQTLYHQRVMEAAFFVHMFTAFKFLPNYYIRTKNKPLYRQLMRIKNNIRIFFGPTIRNTLKIGHPQDPQKQAAHSTIELVNKQVQAEAEDFANTFSHIFGQAIPERSYSGKWYINELNNFRFDFNFGPFARPNLVLLGEINKKYEEKLVEENAGRGLDPEEECHRVFLKIDNTWAWFMDESGHHAKTGELMGHCGNVPQYKDHDVLLNLGQAAKKGTYLPKLTFILNRGILGERKGIKNSRPQKEYHPQIMRLLLDDRILYLGKGQYRTEYDFQIADLEPAQQEELYKTKPWLGDVKLLIKKISGKEGEFLAMVEESVPIWSKFKFTKKAGGDYISGKEEFGEIITALYREDEISQSTRNRIDNTISAIGQPYDYDQKISRGEKVKIVNQLIKSVSELKSRRPKKYVETKKGKEKSDYRGSKLTSGKLKSFKDMLEKHIVVAGSTGMSKIYTWSYSFDKLIEQAVHDAWTWVYSSQEESNLSTSLDEGRTVSGFYFTNTYINSDTDKTSLAISEEDLAKALLYHMGMIPPPFEEDDLAKYISDDSGYGVDGPDAYEISERLQDLLFENMKELGAKSYYSEKECYDTKEDFDEDND